MPTYKLYRGSYHFATVDANSSAEARRMARDFGEGRAKGEVIDYDRAGKTGSQKDRQTNREKGIESPEKEKLEALQAKAHERSAYPVVEKAESRQDEGRNAGASPQAEGRGSHHHAGTVKTNVSRIHIGGRNGSRKATGLSPRADSRAIPHDAPHVGRCGIDLSPFDCQSDVGNSRRYGGDSQSPSLRMPQDTVLWTMPESCV